MRYLFSLLVLAALSSSASAARIPYYRMDSLAYLSSDIVLCDEVRYVKKTKKPEGYEYYEATFTVVQTLKGACRPKEQITVEVDMVYTREVLGWTKEQREKLPALPLGRVLLFLAKEREVWHPIYGGIKLIMGGETYCYGQFLTNPGPLYLAKMAPENIDVWATTPYSEDLLLKDLEAALEKAKGLTKATAVDVIDDVIRKYQQPK